MSEENAQQGQASATGREAVVRRLATTVSQGRLASGELERRLARTYEANTYEELENSVSAGRGAVILDFTEAIVSDENITVDARPNLNNPELIVPEGYTVSAEEAVPRADPSRTARPTSHDPTCPVSTSSPIPGWAGIIVRHPRPAGRLVSSQSG